MAKIWFLIRRMLSFFLSLSALAGACAAGASQVIKGDINLVNERSYPLSEGMCFGQGLACDGEYFYGTGAVKPLSYNAIVKIDARTGKIVKINEMCIPGEMMLKGYSHLGDCCLYNGCLYAACEDFGFRHPAVAVYDAETLDFISYHTVPKEHKGNGRIPWCEIKDGKLYFSLSNKVDKIMILDVDKGFVYAGEIKLDKVLYKVQGGEFLNGRLYITTNSERFDKSTYVVDPETGKTQTAFIRRMGKTDAEAEGIAIYPLEDGSVFHIIDVDSSVHIRSYAPTEDK